MRDTLWVVALELRVAGFILGVLSLASTLVLSALFFDLWRGVAPDGSAFLGIERYGLVGLLWNGALGVTEAFRFVGSVALWVVAALATLAAASTVVGTLLGLVGRGVQHHATWARLFALLIFLGVATAAFGVLSHLPASLTPVGWLLIGGALYSLWALTFCYD